MRMPTHAHLHYKGRIVLMPVAPEESTWGDLIRAIRWWIGKRVDRNGAYTGGRWFFVGGEWSPRGGNTLVRTARLIADGHEETPQFWALSWEHPCGQEKFRRWRTDVGVSRTDEGYELAITTHHWLSAGFIGDEPDPPQPSAPGIIHGLISSRRWQVNLGPMELSLSPIPLHEGDGMDLTRILEDPTRECPLVLVSREHRSGLPLVNAPRLAKLLAGNALVYESQAPGTDKELEWLFPREFRCWNGMVRVYLPRVMFDQKRDGARHRFFWPEQVSLLGSERVEDLIVEGLARRFSRSSRPIVGSISDVEERARRQRFQDAKSKAADSDDDEWKEIYDDEIERLQEETQRLSNERDELRSDNEDLGTQLKTAKFLEKNAREQGASTGQKVQELESLQKAVSAHGLSTTSLSHTIEVIEGICPERIHFTEEAKQSARKAGFNRSRNDLQIVWSILWHMATTLHDMCFLEDGEIKGQFIDVFRQRTDGLDLALTEKKQTKKDSKLRALRTVVFEDREIDITPHVKHGNDRKTCLRVHYSAVTCSDGRKLIVVGHCGDHLDTSGTRKLS